MCIYKSLCKNDRFWIFIIILRVLMYVIRLCLIKNFLVKINCYDL